MLKTQKSMTITGQSIIEKTVDGKTTRTAAEGYSANINFENPDDIAFSNWQIDKALYKENRAICRQDQAEFEDAVYAIQDQLIAEKAGTSEE